MVRAARREIRPANFVVGEVGNARDAPQTNECAAARRTLDAIDAADRFGASHVIAWQIADDPPGGDALTGFGALKYDGSESLLGLGLRHVWAGVVPALPVTQCP